MAFRMSVDWEVVLLTGGASRRMGNDKSSLLVNGESIADRIVKQCRKLDCPTTVLGRNPVKGAEFLADLDEYRGPLIALSRYVPKAQYIAVLSCDIPFFDSLVLATLRFQFEVGTGAVIPNIQNRLQPLCAMYRRESWNQLQTCVENGEMRIMNWIDKLQVKELNETELIKLDISPHSIRSANTPQELESLIWNEKQS